MEKTLYMMMAIVDAVIPNAVLIKASEIPVASAAVKVVEKMPPWTAGKNGGRAVRTWVTLPIKFEVN